MIESQNSVVRGRGLHMNECRRARHVVECTRDGRSYRREGSEGENRSQANRKCSRFVLSTSNEEKEVKTGVYLHARSQREKERCKIASALQEANEPADNEKPHEDFYVASVQ